MPRHGGSLPVSIPGLAGWGGFDVVALRWLVGWLVSLVLGLGLVGSVRFGPGGVLPA